MNEFEYLYVFGYQTPDEDRSNKEFGEDFESTGFFRIVATSETEALQWGHELSKWYVHNLSEKDYEIEWSMDNFASWIEKNPDIELEKASKMLKPIHKGEFPELSDIKSAFFD